MINENLRFGTETQRNLILEQLAPKYDTTEFSNLNNMANGFTKKIHIDSITEEELRQAVVEFNQHSDSLATVEKLRFVINAFIKHRPKTEL